MVVDPILSSPELDRAFTVHPRGDGSNAVLRAWSLEDPARELDHATVEHSRFEPHWVRHLAVIDGAIWVVTSSARVYALATGALLHEVPIVGAAVALARAEDRATLWSRTPTGFRAFVIG